MTSTVGHDPNAFHQLPGDYASENKHDENGTEVSVVERVKEEYLHPCCQKELEATRARTKLMTKLTAADITRHAMERRRNVFGPGQANDQHQHVHGTGCCSLTVDYPALSDLRERQGGGSRAMEVGMPVGSGDGDEQALLRQAEREQNGDEEEEESDDEWLQELEDGDDGGFQEVRRAEMVRRALEQAELQALGVGLHTYVAPARALKIVQRASCPLVMHCYDPYSPISAALDLELEVLAARYPGTRFLRTAFGANGGTRDGRGGQGSKVLRESLRVPAPAPTGEYRKSVVLAVKEGRLVDSCYDFGRRFGDVKEGRVYGEAVEQWLQHCRVLERASVCVDDARRMDGEGKGEGKRGGGGGLRWMRREGGASRGKERFGGEGEETEEEEEEGEEIYDCGVEGCAKTFAHAHVGGEDGGVPREFAFSVNEAANA